MNPDVVARVADFQRRQATRRRERAEMDANRTSGLRRRHATKLARHQENTMPHPPKPLPPPTDDRSARAARETPHMHADQAPPRLTGRHAGYPLKGQLNIVDNLLRVELSNLARDPDPEARRAGLQLAQEAIDALDRLRVTAERSSTRWRRAQAAASKLGEQLDRRRAEISNRPDHRLPDDPPPAA